MKIITCSDNWTKTYHRNSIYKMDAIITLRCKNIINSALLSKYEPAGRRDIFDSLV